MPSTVCNDQVMHGMFGRGPLLTGPGLNAIGSNAIIGARRASCCYRVTALQVTISGAESGNCCVVCQVPGERPGVTRPEQWRSVAVAINGTYYLPRDVMGPGPTSMVFVDFAGGTSLQGYYSASHGCLSTDGTNFTTSGVRIYVEIDWRTEKVKASAWTLNATSPSVPLFQLATTGDDGVARLPIAQFGAAQDAGLGDVLYSPTECQASSGFFVGPARWSINGTAVVERAA